MPPKDGAPVTPSAASVETTVYHFEPLAASVFNLKGAGDPDSDHVRRTREALSA